MNAESRLDRHRRRWRRVSDDRLALVGATIFGALLVTGLVGAAFPPFDPLRVGVGGTSMPPGPPHWFGTDALGRDVFSRVLSGLRVSLLVGLASTALATCIGVVVGGVAGYLGATTDQILSRGTDAVMVIPRFFLAVVLVAIFGASLTNIVLTIGLLSWPVMARVVRAEFLTLRRRGYVESAQAMGFPGRVIIFREILPNASSPIVVTATLLVGEAILLEAGLSYLGLGDPNEVSLGVLLQEAQAMMRQAWWTAAIPGLAILLAVLSVNLIGDGLTKLFNPRLRG